MIAEGTKLLPKHFLQNSCLQPEGRRVKHWLMGWQGLCVMVSSLQVVAVSMRAGSNQLGVGGSIISEDMLVIFRSLFLSVRGSVAK